MRYILLAYLVAGFVGLSIGTTLYAVAEIRLTTTVTIFLAASLALIVACFLGKKLVELVDKKVKVTCPMCNAPALAENHRLQCQLPEYECKRCNSVYRGGVLMEKESP
jgi:predicted RNA-binding Zn-ribbon protein involved in translation (DUF1610 family)